MPEIRISVNIPGEFSGHSGMLQLTERRIFGSVDNAKHRIVSHASTDLCQLENTGLETTIAKHEACKLFKGAV